MVRYLVSARLAKLEGTAEPAVLAFMLAIGSRLKAEDDVQVLWAWNDMLGAWIKGRPRPEEGPETRCREGAVF